MFSNWLVVYHENHMDEVKHLYFPTPDNPQTGLDWLAWLCANLQPGYIVRLEVWLPGRGIWGIDEDQTPLWWEWPTGQPPPEDALAIARNKLATEFGSSYLPGVTNEA